MECISPIKAGFDSAGNLTFSPQKALKDVMGLEFPCRKCLPCRLNQAREKAIRAYHESKMHEKNIFLTLTYSEEKLKSPKLIYEDFQLFMKKLRKTQNEKISFIVTGEYGDINKRPHWHALLFNYRPADEKLLRTTDRGDRVYTSETIDKTWNNGLTEYGEITIDSANYVARYAAKKLTHGKDQDHDFHPIHKTSSKNAIGKSFFDKYYKDILSLGACILPNGQKTKIPRYYLDRLKEKYPEEYQKYYTEILPKISALAQEKKQKEEQEFLINRETYKGGLYPNKKSKVKLTILEQKFNKLQDKLKL